MHFDMLCRHRRNERYLNCYAELDEEHFELPKTIGCCEKSVKKRQVSKGT